MNAKMKQCKSRRSGSCAACALFPPNLVAILSQSNLSLRWSNAMAMETETSGGLTPRRSSLYLLIKRGKRSRAARRRKLSVSLRYFKSPATTRLRTKNCIRLGASQLERMLKPRLRLPREHYRLQFVHEARACSSRELHARNYVLRKKIYLTVSAESWPSWIFSTRNTWVRKGMISGKLPLSSVATWMQEQWSTLNRS